MEVLKAIAALILFVPAMLILLLAYCGLTVLVFVLDLLEVLIDEEV